MCPCTLQRARGTPLLGLVPQVCPLAPGDTCAHIPDRDRQGWIHTRAPHERWLGVGTSDPLHPPLSQPSCGIPLCWDPLDDPQSPVPVALSCTQPLGSLVQPVLNGARRDICSLPLQLLQPLLPCLRERLRSERAGSEGGPPGSCPFTPLNLLLITLHCLQGGESVHHACGSPSSSSSALPPSDAWSHPW